MVNPWEHIDFEDYEKHMQLDSVKQLQVMNVIMKEQFQSYPVQTVMILGIAGGNGLEHIRPENYKRVYGVDINEDYLKITQERYPQLSNTLECLHKDLMCDVLELPQAEFVIANLLIEYIGYEAFQNTIAHVKPKFVSCVIQINTDIIEWISNSPYQHAFDNLDKIHKQMEEQELMKSMQEIGYLYLQKWEYPLPNGKQFLRIDFEQ